MAYFKDTAGHIHFLSDQDITNNGMSLLPAGAQPISDSEADSVLIPLQSLSAALAIRQQRTSLLLQSDWTQIADSPLTSQQKAMWATYRQALRDITKQVTFPTSVVWLVPPS
jgi:hypothetical protein